MKKLLGFVLFCVACLPIRADEVTMPDLGTIGIDSTLSGPRVQWTYSNPVSNTDSVFNATMGDLNLTVGDNSTVNWAVSDIVSNANNGQSGDTFNNAINNE